MIVGGAYYYLFFQNAHPSWRKNYAHDTVPSTTDSTGLGFRV